MAPVRSQLEKMTAVEDLKEKQANPRLLESTDNVALLAWLQ
jgi:hypothetical protein